MESSYDIYRVLPWLGCHFLNVIRRYLQTENKGILSSADLCAILSLISSIQTCVARFDIVNAKFHIFGIV